MPLSVLPNKLSGVFDSFHDLDQIPSEDFLNWLKFKVEINVVENFLGNRLIYPQSVAQTAQDLEIDLAILREAVKRQPNVLYNPQKSRITISPDFANRFAGIPRVVSALADVLTLSETTEIYQKEADQSIGSLVQIQKPLSKPTVKISCAGQPYTSQVGSLINIAYPDNKIIDLTVENHLFKVRGGLAGIFIDLRKAIKS